MIGSGRLWPIGLQKRLLLLLRRWRLLLRRRRLLNGRRRGGDPPRLLLLVRLELVLDRRAPLQHMSEAEGEGCGEVAGVLLAACRCCCVLLTCSIKVLIVFCTGSGKEPTC